MCDVIVETVREMWSFEKYKVLLGNADDVFWECGSDNNMNNSTSTDKRQREL